MKKLHLYILGMAAALFAACSSGDSLLTEDVQTVDDENVTREDLMGDIPIEFATIDGSVSVELTRGSASVNDVLPPLK